MDQHMHDHHAHKAPSGKVEKISISISGMHCASCVTSIESALKSFKGVKDAKVNYASEKATVEYDPVATDLAALEKVIENTGYTVVKPKAAAGENTLKLKVVGMDNPHCVGTVGGAVGSLPGIVSKDLRVNEKAVINYDSSKISAQKIKDVIKEAVKSECPTVIDFVVEREENVSPMVPAGAAINEILDLE